MILLMDEMHIKEDMFDKHTGNCHSFQNGIVINPFHNLLSTGAIKGFVNLSDINSYLTAAFEESVKT